MAKLTVEQALLSAASFAKKGEVAEAQKLYKLVLQAVPNNKRAQQGLEALNQVKSAVVPVSAHQKVVNQLVELYNQKQLPDVIRQAISLTEQYPDAFIIWNILGAAHKGLGDKSEAAAAFRKVTELNPNYADGFNNFGVVLKEQGKLEEAIASYQKALSLKPDYAEVYYNMGIALQDQGKLCEAVASYHKALSLKPDYAEACYNMGNALKAQDKLDEAVASYQKALSLKPDYADAYNNMGNALKAQGKLYEAIALYHKALSLKPDDVGVEAQLLHQKQHICDFDATARLQDLSSRLGNATERVPPFGTLSWVDNAKQQSLRSKVWVSETYKQQPLTRLEQPAVRPSRLKVGYFSADFHDHATMYLMAGLLREHNVDEFELFAYSYGRSKSGNWRKQAQGDVDHFFDVTDYADNEIVDLAHSHRLDVAIDLKGYTTYARSGIFQHSLAPIQMNYLGYPGTMGAEFIDYIIADPVVIPDDQREFYSEQVIYLPHTYQPNDNTREIADTLTTSADFGLPDDAFVFCCFNNNYKISPREFDIWMRLLKKVDDSVLWLLKSNKWAQQNLHKEAALRSVDPGRLVFAEKVSHSEHLARHKHADLFLDTFNVNAHTTASDALWGGLPVVTKQGKQFAARVAASLLNAVGLPELITETEEDYERLILELATQPEKLAVVKAKLADNRLSEPLFDTKRYTRNFEQGLKNAYDLFFEGNRPADIWVREDEV